MGKKSDKLEAAKAKAKAEKKAMSPVPESKPEPAKKQKPQPAAIPKKPVSKPPTSPKAKSKMAPTFEEIQLQAYFVAEKRRAAGLPGDEASDWVQAEKELLASRK